MKMSGPNPLVLRDDWNPSQSESYCPLLKPWLLTFRPFNGEVLVFDKVLLYHVSLAGPVSIGVSSPAIESTLGGVLAPFACNLIRFDLSLSWEL